MKVQLAKLTKRLSEKPELVQRIDIDEDEAIQRMFTPERLAQIAKADAEIDAGLGLTIDQADARLAANRAKWPGKNQY